MKLRQTPEDFIVQEISNLNITKEKQDYKIFEVKKRGIESFNLFRTIASENKFQAKDIGFAGLKDKHAVTTQYISIPSKYDLKEYNDDNLKIRFIGYSKNPIELGDLIGNRFKITVRGIQPKDLKGIFKRANSISEIGVPNYFDSQRFGSVINNRFIAKCLIKKDYETAVKIFLTSSTNFESKQIKDDKKYIKENWYNLENIKVTTNHLNRIIKRYKETKSWIEAYKEIMPNLRQIIASAYQSYIWNECIKLLLKNKLQSNLYDLEYSVGKLTFYDSIQQNKIPKTFNTVSPKMELEGIEKEIIKSILQKEKIALEDFDIKETGNFFKTSARKIISYPKKFKLSKELPDELNKSQYKLILEFELSKGSYATIIIKRIFEK
ncbi:tRNA pseudouridine(13) synthase TruD [Candidatus Woesearchaeota archaeon]|nr:tRNA pseudouridine(13) synthase TruD [Candidatus Woesearchaeota archaeon]